MKISFETKSISEIESIVAVFRNEHKVIFSNYYGLNAEFEYAIANIGNILFVRKTEYQLYRLFFIVADISVLSDALRFMEKGKYIVNIPSRVPIDDKIAILENGEFKLVEEYIRFYFKNIRERYERLAKNVKYATPLPGYALAQTATEEDVSQIWTLLERTFSLNMDYIPTHNELLAKVRKGTVFVNRTEMGEVCGVQVISPKGTTCYMDLVADEKGMGIFLEKRVHEYLLEHNITYCYCWVRKTNYAQVHYQEKLHIQIDGMKDYSFLN